MENEYNIGQEIEIKLDLGSFTNYLKLIGFLGQIDREACQVNSFFDSEDRRLAADGWALRIRTDEHAGFVTLKSRESENTEASVRSELEAEVERSVALAVQDLRHDILSLDVPPINFVREKWGDLQLSKLVHFENTRQTKAFQLGDYMYNLEVDSTRFSDGTVDYELEVELPDEAQVVVVADKLQRLFGSLNIQFVRQEQSKFARALSRAGTF